VLRLEVTTEFTCEESSELHTNWVLEDATCLQVSAVCLRNTPKPVTEKSTLTFF
jgi:hypothetical protein